MKVSIITVSYNSAFSIKKAMDSVLNQSYDNIEYIVIDGKSTDNTVAILKEYKKKFIHSEIDYLWISENDNGIYDAMNKGIKKSTGDIIGILNSDDCYNNSNIIEKVVKIFIQQNIDLIYGNINFTDSDDRIIRKWISKPFKKNSFYWGWHPPHPSLFVKQNVYEKYGLFNSKIRISADFELMLRFFEKYNLKSYYLNEFFVDMSYGGASTGSFRNIINGNIDCIKAFKYNDLFVNPFYPIFRLLPKLSQFLIKKNK